jgi:hypothetical protein
MDASFLSTLPKDLTDILTKHLETPKTKAYDYYAGAGVAHLVMEIQCANGINLYFDLPTEPPKVSLLSDDDDGDNFANEIELLGAAVTLNSPHATPYVLEFVYNSTDSVDADINRLSWQFCINDIDGYYTFLSPYGSLVGGCMSVVFNRPVFQVLRSWLTYVIGRWRNTKYGYRDDTVWNMQEP